MGIHWLILITLAFVFIQAKVYKLWGLKSIEYSRYFDKHAVFQDETTQMVEVISNNKILPVFWLRLESKMSAGLNFQHQLNLDIKHQQYHKSLFSLMPFTKITRRHQIQCTKRGCFSLNSASITCGDAFGVHTLYKDILLSSQILVYPKLVPIKEINLPFHSWQGDVVVRRWIIEDPFMILGVRDYRSGDPLNRINWKATARLGQFQVHNTNFTANTKLIILLNFEKSDDTWDNSTDPDFVEKGISYAASIAHHTITQGIETGFGCNGPLKEFSKEPVYIAPHCSTQHLSELFDVFAMLLVKNAVSFHTFLQNSMLKLTENTDVLIMTAFISERLQNQIQNIRNRGNQVEVMLLQ